MNWQKLIQKQHDMAFRMVAAPQPKTSQSYFITRHIDPPHHVIFDGERYGVPKGMPAGKPVVLEITPNVSVCLAGIQLALPIGFTGSLKKLCKHKHRPIPIWTTEVKTGRYGMFQLNGQLYSSSLPAGEIIKVQIAGHDLVFVPVRIPLTAS